MSTTNFQERTWSLKEATEHPLIRKYGVTERQLRRAVQSRQIEFTRPGGLKIRLTHQNIVEFIESSRNAPLNRGEKR